MRPWIDVSIFEGDDLRPSVRGKCLVLEVPDVIVPFGVFGKSSTALLRLDVPSSSRNPASLDRREPPDRALLLSPFVVDPCGRSTRPSLADGSERPNLALGDLRTLVSPDETGLPAGFGTTPYVLTAPILKVRRARQEKHVCCMLIMLDSEDE